MESLSVDRERLRGLSDSEAQARLVRDGPNTIPEAKPHPAWRLLVAELTHFFALMLWVAAGLAFAAALPELGIAIIVVIVVNGVFAFVQERRAP
jgi:magnesium-transporting ATPase (P-type)